jgi:hypothetical protein
MSKFVEEVSDSYQKANATLQFFSGTKAVLDALSASEKKNGAIAFMTDLRVGAEGAGVGTGGFVVYKEAGPAGAGWYITSGASLGAV